MKICIEFSGGAELLADGQKKHELDVDADKCPTLRELLVHVRDTIIKERPELFMQEDTVRPGILVLINDTDWELMDELAYRLQENDQIVFISTLHGG